MFKKILIANRGAIATRIERTLKSMGIISVAVYSQADRYSLHVQNADEALFLGAGTSNDTYLDADKIIKLAKENHIPAIIPGYGFLSENAQFAQECEKNGIKFIGPHPRLIHEFGLKHIARKYARQANVPLLPSSGLLSDISDALSHAKEIGYPVILKSSAGGGGVGMQICKDEKQLSASFSRVKNEAANNFHDADVFLEKYVEKARHIEVQIFGSNEGNVTSIGERDCTLQRRNQKVIEEAPAPNISDDIRRQLHSAAERLGNLVHYNNIGTVEFIYDAKNETFYFLEVNTRIQVEHGVTEQVYNVDLVKWMIQEASGEMKKLPQTTFTPNGHSFEARLYAEDPASNFRPSVGTVDDFKYPTAERIDTWIERSIKISPYYDSLLAKIVIHDAERDRVLRHLDNVLSSIKIFGVATNLKYLHQLINLPETKQVTFYTSLLNHLNVSDNSIEVLDGGFQTTIQDYPGRIKYWSIGVPPSGPMDNLSFRLANELLGNPSGTAGLEFTIQGGKYKFRSNTLISLTGANMHPQINGHSIAMYQPITVNKGDILSLSQAENGMRAYLAVDGGIDTSTVLGSQSTFILGKFGGQNGRALRIGDVLNLKSSNTNPQALKNTPITDESSSPISHTWRIAILPGPHNTSEFFKKKYMEQFIKSVWTVHFDSDRTGIRLIGPAPKWSRKDGGEAGLHPSNIHDNAYAQGTLDMTGDMPIILGPDGPSLGGFVCPATVASFDLWKTGQLKPGDKIHFDFITKEEANKQLRLQDQLIKRKDIRGLYHQSYQDSNLSLTANQDYAILFKKQYNDNHQISIRLDGDSNLLLEFGKMTIDILSRVRVQLLENKLKKLSLPGILDLTPGIRTLQIHFNPEQLSMTTLLAKVIHIDESITDVEHAKFKSRVIHLPLSWHDKDTVKAMKKYQVNVRPDAPWCPDNIEFIRRINGLKSIRDVQKIISHAKYLVLGLGDVYLGAPVAIPLDPRHKLVTTKYNPARPWTPENAVGIGGAYMCVYGMEGPGGYQMFGRTTQMWNLVKPTEYTNLSKPWLLNTFDQIQFYLVSHDELIKDREDFLHGNFKIKIEDTVFDVAQYLSDIKKNDFENRLAKKRQQSAFEQERTDWEKKGLLTFNSQSATVEKSKPSAAWNGPKTVCKIPGSVWKILVNPGDHVKKGQPLLVQESMKMEVNCPASSEGIVDKILVKSGDIVQPGDELVHLKEISQ